MGKQMTYYMSFREFLQVAQVALEEGCVLLPAWHTPEPPTPLRDLSGIDPSRGSWFFLLPGAPEPTFVRDRNGDYFLSKITLDTHLIETGFSVQNERGLWSWERLYIATYAVEDGALVPRTEEATRIYDRLARLVRKLCPLRTYPIGNERPVKARVSADIAAQAGENGQLLGCVHSRLHPCSPSETAAQMQTLLDALSDLPIVIINSPKNP